MVGVKLIAPLRFGGCLLAGVLAASLLPFISPEILVLLGAGAMLKCFDLVWMSVGNCVCVLGLVIVAKIIERQNLVFVKKHKQNFIQ